uniref:Uncharacterized protein n=1 Tax=Anguilla anguilla TaxID=7936 RepID=A0A0E9RBN8_ANGAN
MIFLSNYFKLTSFGLQFI